MHSEYAREKNWSRIHLLPVLEAEEDRDQVRRHLADQKREKELLGENMKVYHNNRYACPPSPMPSSVVMFGGIPGGRSKC